MLKVKIKDSLNNNTLTERQNYIQWDSFSITEVLSNSPDSCDFFLKQYGNKTYEPKLGEELLVELDGTLIFGGYIVDISKSGEALTKKIKIKCKDYTHILDRILISKTYTNQTANTIISDLISTYAPSSGFTTSGVVANVTVQKIVFNYITLSTALSKLATMLGTFDWNISPAKDIQFFDSSTISAPFEINDTGGNFNYSSLDIKLNNTQLKNKIVIRGGLTEGSTFTDNKLADGVQKLFFVGYNLTNFSASLNKTVEGLPYAKYTFDNVLTNSGSSTSSSLSANNGTPTFVTDSDGIANNARQYTGGARDTGTLQASINGNWALEWKGKRNASGTGTNWALVEVGNYSANTGFGIWVDNTDNQINIRVNQIWGGSNSAMKTGYILPLNTAVKLFATYDGSNIKFYVNDVLTKTIPFTTNPNASTQIFVGARGDTVSEYQISICDYIKIHNSNAYPTTIQTINLNIGIDGKDNETSFDAMYNADNGLLRFKDSNIPTSNTPITYSGNPNYPLLTEKSDLSSIAKYGEYQAVIVDKSIKSKASASQRATAELLKYSRPQAQISFTTLSDGLKTGQTININSPSYGLINEKYKIINIIRAMKTPEKYIYQVNLALADDESLVGLLKSILIDSQADKVDISNNEIVDRLYSILESINMSEQYFFSKSHNLIQESLAIVESIDTKKDFAIEFVLGEYTPSSFSDTKRVFNLDGALLG